MIGGAQGSGVDTSANIFGRSSAYAGLHVFGTREYHSNIKGLHSYFKLRVSSKIVRSAVNKVNLLTTLDAETIFRHFRDVSDDGGIIYDPALVKVKITDLHTIDDTLKMNLQKYFTEKSRGVTVEDALKDVTERGVKIFPVEYSKILLEASKKLGERQSKLLKMVNIISVAVSFKILKFDSNYLIEAIRNMFNSKPKIMEWNVTVSEIVNNSPFSGFEEFSYSLTRQSSVVDSIFLMGNQAIALGKLAGGCRFQTYYPITPAADESEYLEANELIKLRDSSAFGEGAASSENGSILVMQTEDEIAAVTMATGGALTGARASTSTSSPGFSLMMEGISYSGSNEIPIVITHYQRAGPSTGLPTRHEQADLRFTIHSGGGEFPKIVLTSGDLEECFYDAAAAFNYAERYQMPVIHLIDKALANSNATIPRYDVNRVKIDRGDLFTLENMKEIIEKSEKYKRFEFTKSGVSKRAFLGGEGTVFWNTGDEHDESGHISENPSNRIEMVNKRMRKLDLVLREIQRNEKIILHGDIDSEITLVSWGSTKGAILDAIDQLKSEGHKLNFLQIRLLQPFPEDEVREILLRSKKKVDVEMNYSAQLAGIVAEKCQILMDHFILKYNGRPITCDEIYDSIKSILSNEAQKRMVLTNGV